MESLDDLTIDYFEGDLQTVKQLDKAILSKGAWSTIVFRYQEWDRTRAVYSADKYAIRRYQKRLGQYQLKSKFTLSSAAQAGKLIEILSAWMEEAPSGAT